MYASAKKENNYFGFGTDNDVEYTAGYPVIKHRTFGRAVPPSAPMAAHEVELPCAKVIGAGRDRPEAFRPKSVVNISAMSFGSLSGSAIEALNRGAVLADCLHNTGEGGISRYHRHGGELIFQIGTAYFGCRDAEGRFNLDKLKDVVAGAPVRALEIKLSQGVKPSLGGLLPAPKVSAEIAAARGIPEGRDCVSPSRHAEFSDTDSLLDWVELLAAETGLPVGIKSAVGDLDFWHELTDLMRETGRGVDFVTIDGGEGGAAPLIFTDTVSLPFQLGFARVYRIFAERGLHEQVTFIGGGKLGLPDNAVVGFALGCRHDQCCAGADARDRMHPGSEVPHRHVSHRRRHAERLVGPWLVPEVKAVRVANYIKTLRRDLVKVAEACGVEHPGLISTESVDILDGRTAPRRCTRSTGTSRAWAVRRRPTARRSSG